MLCCQSFTRCRPGFYKLGVIVFVRLVLMKTGKDQFNIHKLKEMQCFNEKNCFLHSHHVGCYGNGRILSAAGQL